MRDRGRHQARDLELDTDRVRGMRAMAAALLDLVAPRDCTGCSTPGWSLCPMCQAALVARDPWWHHPGSAAPVAVGGLLEGRLGAVVRAYKSGSRNLAGPLSLVVARSLALALEPIVASTSSTVIVTAIPASRRALWSRGEDILDAVVRPAVRSLRRAGHPVVHQRLLEPGRSVLDQRTLTAAQRSANVAGSLRSRGRPPEEVPLIVVDDVLTTGATLGEAASILGPSVAACAVIAMTPDRREGTSDRRGGALARHDETDERPW